MESRYQYELIVRDEPEHVSFQLINNTSHLIVVQGCPPRADRTITVVIEIESGEMRLQSII
jgi:hypothetical protein